VDDLPLFAATRPRSATPEPAAHPAADDALGAALDGLDPDGLSPREALDALYRLKGMRHAARS